MATYARNCGIVSNQFAANLPRNLLVKRIENRLRFDRIMATSLWSHILAHSSCNVTVVGIYHSRCNDQQFRCSQALNLRHRYCEIFGNVHRLYSTLPVTLLTSRRRHVAMQSIRHLAASSACRLCRCSAHARTCLSVDYYNGQRYRMMDVHLSLDYGTTHYVKAHCNYRPYYIRRAVDILNLIR